MRKSKWGNRLYYGGIAGLILLFYKTIMTLLGNNNPDTIFGTINMLFEVTLIVFSINIGVKKYKEEIICKAISFKQAFTHSFFIYFIAALLGNLYQWIEKAFIFEKSENIEILYQIIANTYGATFADANYMILEMMVTPVFLFMSYIVSTVITSVIIAAILSVFINKKS